MNTEITTARLRMRRSRRDDLEAVHALASHWDVVKQTATWPWPPDRVFTEARVRPIDPADGMGGPVFTARELVGLMGVIASDGRPELGYMFAPDHWGRGYATEMAGALIAHAWKHFEWPSIFAGALADNPASSRVLLKLGFTEGDLASGPSTARGPGEFALRTFHLSRP